LLHTRQVFLRFAQLGLGILEVFVALVGDYFNVASDLIFSKSRKAPVVHARHIAIYLVREITGDSWTHVASEFGDRDHSSMMHAYKKIMAAMKEDSELRGTVEILRRRAYPEG
jgi:chromosomal replication initiator protein